MSYVKHIPEKSLIFNNLQDIRVAIIGLGYVGLPLAIEFGKKYQTIGFDTNTQRIRELRQGKDLKNEIFLDDFILSSLLTFSDTPEPLKDADIFIVTVPTPVDSYKKPDIRALLEASRLIGRFLKPGGIVIYESTVYPGCTEEECVPVLEKTSGLSFNVDFFCGYSPERISPGDRTRRLPNIRKVTSGSTPDTAAFVDRLYSEIIPAGTFPVSSIRVAEASKALENAQRDVNISFMNEMALLFDKLNLDTHEVLEAAGTKWNFIPFRPGFVGGHCISVDPYYLLHKAYSVGYSPEVLLSGRRINDQMGLFVANKVIKLMIKKGHRIEGSKVLILGLTYKANCPDTRNSKVFDVISELRDFGAEVDVFDPIADSDPAIQSWQINPARQPDSVYDAVIAAVPHNVFDGINWDQLTREDTVVYDVNGTLPRHLVTARL